MAKRRTMDLAETFGDFWLGMAGAVADGFATVTRKRRERKADDLLDDEHAFIKDVTEGLKAAVSEAVKVVKEIEDDLGERTPALRTTNVGTNGTRTVKVKRGAIIQEKKKDDGPRGRA
jgi:hypothetical protein